MSSRRTAPARCVGDTAGFARDFWGRRPLVRHGVEPFDDLLDIAAVEELLTNVGRRPTFRVVKANCTIAEADYVRRMRLGGAEVDGVADLDRVLDLVADGATVVLQGLHRTWTPLREFCLELEEAATHAVQANAYLSPPGATGLAPHADRHDVFVLQVAGAKHWTVDGLGEVELTSGGSMYVPAGTRHAARTAATFSLHITIGLMATTRRHVLHRVVDGLAGDLDRPLPFGYGRGDEAALAAEIGEVVRAAADQMSTNSPQQLARDEVLRLRRRVRTRNGRLAAAVDPASFSDARILRRRRGSMLRVETAPDGSVLVEFDDRRLRMPASAADAMALIAERTDVRIGELTGLDRSSRVVVARRLVREGLLELVDE